jgi:hypothetical protein
MAFLILSYYFPIFEQPIKNKVSINFSPEIKIFILFLLLLLTYPIGVLINGISWFLLGWMEKWFETFWFKNKCFLTLGTRNYLCFEKLKVHYKLTKDNFYETCRLTEAHLLANHEKLLSLYDESLGKSILFRNLTFCTLVIAPYFLIQLDLWIFSILVLITLIFVVCNSIISFYYSLAILLLNWKYEKTPAAGNAEQLGQEQ